MEQKYPFNDNHELTDLMIAHNALVSTIGGHYDRYILYTLASLNPGLVTSVVDYERQFNETYDYVVAGLPLPEGVPARPTMPIPLPDECKGIVNESRDELQRYAMSTEPEILRDVFKASIGDAYHYPPPDLTNSNLELFQALVLLVAEPVSREPLTDAEIEEILSRPTEQLATQIF